VRSEHRERTVLGLVVALVIGAMACGGSQPAGAAPTQVAAAPANGVQWFNPVLDNGRIVLVRRTTDPTGALLSDELIERSLTDGRESVLSTDGNFGSVVADSGWTSWQQNFFYGGGGNAVTSFRASNGYIETTLTDSSALLTDMKGRTISLGNSSIALPALGTTIDVVTQATTEYVHPDVPYQGSNLATFTRDGLAITNYQFAAGYGPSTTFVGAVGETPHQVQLPVGCSPQGLAASSGNLVVVEGYCGNFEATLLTCTLPCTQFTAVTPPTGQPGSLTGNFNERSLKTDGRYVVWSSVEAINVFDLRQPERLYTIPITGWIDGLSFKNGELAWVQTSIRNGVREMVALTHTIGTSTFTKIAPGQPAVVLTRPTAIAVRTQPDIDGNTVMYSSKDPGGQTSIFTQGLRSRSANTVVSLGLTDVSSVRLTNGYAYWSEASQPLDLLRYRRLAGGPTQTVFPTPDLVNIGLLNRLEYDASGPNASWAISPYYLASDPNVFRSSAVFSRTLPAGPVTDVTSDEVYPLYNGRLVSSSGDRTAFLTVDSSTRATSIRVTSPSTPALTVAPSGLDGGCSQVTGLALDGSTLVLSASSYCTGLSTVSWCSLPCSSWQSIGLNDVRYTDGLSLSGQDVVYRANGPIASAVESSALYTLRLRAGEVPKLITADSGTISRPRISNGTIVWATTAFDLGVKSGVVYTYDIKRGVITTLR
jgi:glutamine cyclotransferase